MIEEYCKWEMRNEKLNENENGNENRVMNQEKKNFKWVVKLIYNNELLLV